ncbi:2-phosphosulfolactate phosphatase [Rhodococcoides kyotonense]|uniref:Probable 2-phosphosulfolactate phosphatase n=1 Tax=Rhodococcoides kyotonense TaxID=398843 RepID=A0A177YPD2_9NOCA|nr:2-phosphosulfolactate phosphatase [Rhodococcus kyotonensis]OAK57446.1 2-phosphosulfolactate phosphatase [Rhodococcus kyotonensis]
MHTAHRQRSYSVRFDWGSTGASAIGADADVAVVVDVLSFTTTLSVAVDRGVEVFPYRWRDDGAARFAADRGTVLAVGRREARASDISLSPGTVRSAQGLARLVLPSPNGSSIAHSLSASSGVCIGASLRNASSVAEWISANYRDGSVVSVIAAGERWPDGSLRPSVEDLWGAGAVLAELVDRRPNLEVSPEAEVAVATWNSITGTVEAKLQSCASGRELVLDGYPSDVAIAAEVGRSRSVPILREDRFVNHGRVLDN